MTQQVKSQKPFCISILTKQEKDTVIKPMLFLHVKTKQANKLNNQNTSVRIFKSQKTCIRNTIYLNMNINMKNPSRIIRTLENMPYENSLVELDLIGQRGKHHRKNTRTAFLYKKVSRWNETVPSRRQNETAVW